MAQKSPSCCAITVLRKVVKDIDQDSTEAETKALLQDVRQYPALRKCKEDSFKKSKWDGSSE
jgi:hypothetical protein